LIYARLPLVFGAHGAMLRGREIWPGCKAGRNWGSMMKRILRTFAAVAALSMAITPAFAQTINARANGTYGRVTLSAGFEPDPHVVTLSAGGPVDASTLGEDCTGSIARRPDFSLTYRPGDLPLYIAATSDADTTIVVRAPDGSYVCDDDSAGALNPAVRFETPARGRYQIWVGTFGADAGAPAAMLHISEIAAPDAIVESQPDPSLEPAFGTVDLTAGFTPDPHTKAISAGGGFDASGLASTCTGWIAQAPDYRVNWTAGPSGLPLLFSVDAGTDTTLVINDAQGNWICDDDGGNNGLNPAITFNAPPSGQYDVWVGTFSSGDLQKSTLHVSELTAQ
jgi:hypothetical protein